MTQTAYGQTVALADAIVVELNAASLCLAVSAERKFARLLDLKDIPKIGESVRIDVFPGDELEDRTGLSGTFIDTYGVHFLIQQQVTDTTNGGISETQVSLLMQLRSQIIEMLCSRTISGSTAVHPFSKAHIIAVRHGAEGVYDLAKLEGEKVFYSDSILTYKAPVTRR